MASTQALVGLLILLVVNLNDSTTTALNAWYKVQGNDWAREGRRSLTWKCELEGPDSAALVSSPSYEWLKDGSVIPGKTDQILTLFNVTGQDAGRYQCGPPGSSVQRKSLDLHVRVTGDPIPEPGIAQIKYPVFGGPFSLNCLILEGYTVGDDTVFSWHKNSAVITGQSKQELHFPNVTQADEGKYTCTAREGPDESPPSPEYHLTVIVSPQVRIQPSGPRGILGENLTLTCEVTEAYPEVPADGYSWSYRPLQQETKRPLVGKTRTLTLGPLTMEDRGQYFCQARNNQKLSGENLTGQASVDVDIVYLENITLTSHLEVNEGDRVTLTCAVDSHPTAHLAWTVNGQEVRHVTDNRDHYVIMSAACSDSTNYTCAASNTEMPGRERNATTRVLVQCKQEDMAWSDHQSSTHVTLGGVSAVTGLVGMLIGAVLAINFHKIRSFCKHLMNKQTRKHQTESGVPVENGETPEDRAQKFESLYEKGKVYVFPRLVPREDSTAASSDDDTEDESQPFLGHNEVKDEYVEYKMKNLLRVTLQSSMSAHQGELPSFVLHNTGLDRQGHVTLVVDRRVGVVVMVTNLIKTTRSQSSLQKSVTNLRQARDAVMRRLKGLVQHCDVTAVLSLPYLTPQQSDDVKILSSQPDVELLAGLDRASYHQWMEDLRREKASKVWSSQAGDHPDTLYKMAASSFLTLAGCGGESPPSPDPAQSWLLTPAQVEVRDSTARLLHVWGPPGSGKTTLLVHRARQWLAEEKAVVLAVGRQFFDVNLSHMAKAVQDKNTKRRTRLCRTHEEIERSMKELGKENPGKNIGVIIDNLCQDETLKKILSYVHTNTSVSVCSSWEQNLHAIDTGLSKQAIQLGWESLELPACIRCTKDTVELLNLLRENITPIPVDYCMPRTPEVPKYRVVDHCRHPNHISSLSKCRECKTEMSRALPSTDAGLHWNEWVALYTGHDCIDFEPLHQALLHLGVPSTYRSDNYIRTDDTRTSQSRGERDSYTFQELVDAGVDEEGNPAVHFLWIEDFTGMERKGVILVHWDDEDENPEKQSQADRSKRFEEHRRRWIHAVSRSRGQVILLLLTPSPARSLLPELVMAPHGDAPQSASSEAETAM